MLFRQLESDAAKLHKKLSDQCEALESALADLEGLGVDLGRIDQSADRVRDQSEGSTHFSPPLTMEKINSLLAQCQLMGQTFNSKEMVQFLLEINLYKSIGNRCDTLGLLLVPATSNKR